MNRRRLVLVSAVVIGAMTLLAAWAWLSLPADALVPTHWNMAGEVDGWADKTIGLFLLPLMTVGIAALFWIIPVVEPRRANIERSGKAYGAIWLGVLGLMGIIQVIIVAAAMGSTMDTTLVVFVGTGVLFIIIGNYLPKVRSNYMMGIRTPWTLTSELSWDRTHRAGGRLFVAEGIAFILVGLLRPPAELMFGLLMGSLVVMLVFVFVYSYRVWLADPHKRRT